MIFICFPLYIMASELNSDSLQQKLYTTYDPINKIKLLNQLSQSWLDDDISKASDFANEALSLSETENDIEGKGESFCNLALISFRKGDYLTSINHSMQSKADFQESGNQSGYARASLILGKVYARKFEYDKSLAELYVALEIFQTIKEYDKLAETYNSIGGIYYDQHNYDEAFRFFQNSLNEWSKVNNSTGLAIAYNNIGEIYRLKGQLHEAMGFYRQALPINIRINRPDNLAYNYDNIANIFLSEKQYDSVKFYLEESLAICKRISNGYIASFVYLSFGRLYKQAGILPVALNYFDSSYQAAAINGALTNVRDATMGLSEIYKEKKDFEKAYNYHLIYKKIADSLINIRNEEELTRIEMKLIFDHENKLKSGKLERARYLYFLISFGLLSLLVIAFLLYGRLRIKNKHIKTERENLLLESQNLSKELNYKNRELATNVIYLVKKNEMINFISEKLLKAKTRFKTENQELIQQLILDLQSSIDTQIWKTFEQRFLDVHKEFYEKLKSNFPDLSENDRKLCALLRLNLCTKDIASITHQNPNSIEVARTRLRKKLNLSNKSISLITFLDSI
jgi:tetratricopeptide (TPR) repeat protein